MRKQINRIIVGVAYKPTFTPISLYAIAARLDAQTIRNLAHQVRNNRMASFQVDMGEGIVVSYPPQDDDVLRVWIPDKRVYEKTGGPAAGEEGSKPAGETSGTQQEK